MSAGPPGTGSPERLREASDWFVKYESGDSLSPDSAQEWERWAADPANAKEYSEIVRMREQLRGLSAPPVPTAAELQANSFATLDAPGQRDSTPWGRAARLAMAATIAGLAAGVVLLLKSDFDPRTLDMPFQSYETGTGDHREITFPDGSVALLGGQTALSVRYTNHSRLVVLNRGEALFKVARHSKWPFRVVAGGGTVTAVGTEFDILRRSDQVVVAVTEGAVEVAPGVSQGQSPNEVERLRQEDTQWIPLRVAGGQEMSYRSRGNASAAYPVDSRLASSWTRGTFVYRGQRLREVVEDVQRYSSLRISLDPAVADFEYTGTVLQRKVDQWVRHLPEIFPVQVSESESTGIIIQPLAPAPAHQS